MKAWPFPLVRVKQVNWNGCAIASVATACGVTYERARATCFPKRKYFEDDKSLHLNQEQVQRACAALGFHTKISSTFRWSQRPAIVTVSWDPNSSDPTCHSVVWDPYQKKFLDPGADHDHGRYNANHFMKLWKNCGYSVVIVTGQHS